VESGEHFLSSFVAKPICTLSQYIPSRLDFEFLFEKNTVQGFGADSQGAIVKISSVPIFPELQGYFFMCRASWNLVLVYRAWKPFLLMVSSV
jgi:hypothetical protein